MSHQANDRTWVKEFYDSAADWWGESWYDGENLEPRLAQVKRFIGNPPRHLLELGAGTGETAAYLAAAGYKITAVDLSEKNYDFLCKVQEKYPDVSPIKGDFLTAPISGQFDAVCLFESFGMGTDADQRRLLNRIAQEWLAPGGVVLMDVYHPFGPIRIAGTAQSLGKLPNIPGSVDMTERAYYDAVLGRWIDEWEPVNDAASTRRQSIRCYTPADLLLLLEGTGLKIKVTEFDGKTFDPSPANVIDSSPLLDYEKNYAYTVILSR